MKKLLTVLCMVMSITACAKKVYDPAQDPKNWKDPSSQEQKEEEKTDTTATDPDAITAPPASVHQWLDGKESALDPFYKKYLDMDGMPVMSSEAVSDSALYQARYIARHMLSRLPDALNVMIEHHFRIVVVGYKENITDVPECSVWPEWWPDVDWDERGRGYGATDTCPVMTIGEENLVKIPNFQERYYSESIMVHEFGHNVDFAQRIVDPSYEKALLAAYKNAQNTGLWKGTYSMSNSEEYFAEGAQAWFNTCRMVVPTSTGGSMKLKTREQLKSYDKQLYDVLESIFPEEQLKGYHFDYE